MIARIVRQAHEATDLQFSVVVGAADTAPRVFAGRLLAALGADAKVGVLVFVDPAARQVEIVTGAEAHNRIDDRACALAAISMSTSFAVGDLTGGLTDGLRMLAQAGTRPRTLHVEHAD